MDLLSLFAIFATTVLALTCAQEVTPDGCFEKQSGRELKCGQSVGVIPGISEQECLNRCREQFNCAALNYNTDTDTCEMFSIAARGNRGGRRRAGGRQRQSSSGSWQRGRRRPQGRGRRRQFNASTSSRRHRRSSTNKVATASNTVQQDWGFRNGRGGPGFGPPPGAFPPPRGFGPGGPRGFNGGRGRRRCKRGGGRHGCRGGRRGGNRCGYQGASLVTSPGVNYYRWTGNCARGTNTTPRQRPTTTTPRPTLPDGATCEPGFVPRYLKLEGVELDGDNGVEFRANNEQACLAACTENETPDGQFAPCLAFEYNEATRRCFLLDRRGPPDGDGNLVDNAAKSYYEKVCLDEGVVTGCPNIFNQFPQKVLVGFAEGLSTVDSYEQCVDDCLNSQELFGFQCTSGMYYPDETTDNCILNSQDRRENPDLFIDEDLDVVTYFETGCNRGNRLVADPSGGRPGLIHPGVSEWSHWSGCNKKTQKRVRFRNCKTSNPKTCEV